MRREYRQIVLFSTVQALALCLLGLWVLWGEEVPYRRVLAGCLPLVGIWAAGSARAAFVSLREWNRLRRPCRLFVRWRDLGL